MFTVVGEYRDPVLATGFVIDQATYDALAPVTQRDPFWILATTTPGADQAQVQAGLKAAMAAYPTSQVQTKTQYTDAVKQFDEIIKLDSTKADAYVQKGISISVPRCTSRRCLR